MGTKIEIKAFIASRWESGQYLTAILKTFDNAPNLLYPFGELDEKKDQDPKSFVFWWRQLFHFIGGCVLALPFIGWASWYAIVCILFVLMLFKELFSDVPDSAKPFGFKNIADILAWCSGAFVVLR